MGALLSTSSTPRLYKGIKLLLADPEKRFPLEFNPEDPFEEKKLKPLSRQGFIRSVERLNGAFVVALEDFDVTGRQPEEAALEDVELRDRATYIVIPHRDTSYEKRVSSFAAFCSVVDFQIIADLCSKIK